ncbi:MAG: chloride channel protein, partial [Cyanobacteriota bacterium]|jgi:CIC family chloride channel protein
VEELMRDVSGLTLETAIVASFVGAVTSLVLQSPDLNLSHHLSESLEVTFSLAEIPFYVLLGVLAGILGTLLNRGILTLQTWQRRWDLSLTIRIGAAGLICGAAIALLPPFFRDNAGLREVVLTGDLGWRSTLLMLSAHFLLAMVAYSTDAPGGLFAPALVMGGALGYLVGNVEGAFFADPTPITFALAGMGAFFTSVVRVPVTAIVIVFELTGKFNVILPLMVSCAVAYLVAETLFPRSLYDHLLEFKGINLKQDLPQGDFLSQVSAAQVMQSQVESLRSDQTLEQVLPLMSQSHHRGFPVLEGEKLVGIFTQTDLANSAQRERQTPLRELMTPNPITVFPGARLSDVLYLLNRYQLSRLPVIDNQRLVGIITRTDIIREEVSQLGNQSHRPHPGYVVYQTRSPESGHQRLLLPLGNPKTADALFTIAAALAQHYTYDLECLKVYKVPKHRQPSEYGVPTQKSRRLLQHFERLARRLEIPIQTQIQLSHRVADAVLETVRDQRIPLLVLGWSGKTSETELFNRTVGALIEQAPCDLLLVKAGEAAGAYPQGLAMAKPWLVPFAGGPNVERALDFLPALLSLYPQSECPEILLTTVYDANQKGGADPEVLKSAAENLAQQISQLVVPLPLCLVSLPGQESRSVGEELVSVAQTYDCGAILIGASREGLLQTLLRGNLPHFLATHTSATVLVFRSALEEG